jgi:TIR domain
LKPFDVFICHKKSSGKDFAEHLKAGLEELGYHSFLDSKDIPKVTDGRLEWIQIRDQALRESHSFILIITPGFDLSQELKNELKQARAQSNKQFIYFRHRDLGRKIIVDLENEKVDLGRQEQVSFETKEELLRLAHGILLKFSPLPALNKAETTKRAKVKNETDKVSNAKTEHKCEMCSKPIKGQNYVELIDEKQHDFDCKECALTYRKLKSVYGGKFQ